MQHQQQQSEAAGRSLSGETSADVATRTPKLGEKPPEGAIKVDKIAPRRRI